MKRAAAVTRILSPPLYAPRVRQRERGPRGKGGFINVFGMFVVVLAVLRSAPAHTETVIVAHPSSNVTGFSEDEIRAIFLGKMTRLSDGRPITIFIQGDGPAHDDVLGKLLNKSDAQFMSYWARRVFSGRSAPPLTLGSDAEV